MILFSFKNSEIQGLRSSVIARSFYTSMDFVTRLAISINRKVKTMTQSWSSLIGSHYESLNVTFDALGLAEIILNMVVRHLDSLDLIVDDQGLVSTCAFSFYVHH